MNARTVTVDFSKKNGKIKPLHALSEGARRKGVKLSHDLCREFLEIGVPAVRLHDVEYPYGSNQFVDLHCVFPDPLADPELPESYNFAPTDAYIRAIREVGTDVIFRIGESTDLFPKTVYTKMRMDNEKLSSVCEHILAHFNEGWADGLKMNLRRVEIFGGADDVRVFSGTGEEFFELYRVLANRIRERFPKIKIGGYGSGGFYAMNRLSSTEEQKKFIPYMRAFLKYITSEETAAPLDFFTWYSYPATPEELLLHARYARSVLDEYGLRRVQSVICGYNTASFLSDDVTSKPSYAAELASLLIALQKSDADMAIAADSPISASYGSTFITGGIPSDSCPLYHTLQMFGELYRLGGCVETSGDTRGEIYTLGATSAEKHALMICSRTYVGNIELRINGSDVEACRIRRIAPKDSSSFRVFSVCGEIPVKEGKAAFRVDRDAVYLIDFPR